MEQWTPEQKAAFDQRMKDALDRLEGRWPDFLRHLGMDEKIFNRKNQPCPLPECGGTDRFQFTDRYRIGNYVCRTCGPGAGIKLAMEVCGLNAGEVLYKAERWLGTAAAKTPPQERKERSREDIERTHAAILGGARQIRRGDPVDRYLTRLELGMDTYPAALLCHPRLPYYEYSDAKKRSVKVGEFAAMVAIARFPDDRIATLHRIYLQDGRLAPVASPKKLSNDDYMGSAVRLTEAAGPTLAVGEGIENSLAVLISHNASTWSAMNSGNLAGLWVPDHVSHLKVYGDNDADGEFTGEVAAYMRAQAFIRSGKKSSPRTAEVHIPKVAGSDWKRVLQEKRRRERDARAGKSNLRVA